MKLLISLNGSVSEFTPDPNLGIITVGRADNSDISLMNEKAASREHLTLERTVDGWKLVDQMSANGTSLNGEKVNFAFIKDGDVIQVGEAKIQVTGLNPAPGAKPAPARPVRRADAPRAAIQPGEYAEHDLAPIPPAKSPVPALVALVIIVLVLGAGGYFVVSQIGTGGGGEQVADQGQTGPRQAELSDEEKAALKVAEGIVSSDSSTIEKIQDLEGLQAKLKGKRGSKALSDITDMKAKLTRSLDGEITVYVQDQLAGAQTEGESDNYADAMAQVDELKAYLESDPLLASLGKAHKLKIEQAVSQLTAGNTSFLARSYNKMWEYANQHRYDEAIALCDDVVARAWFETGAEREAYAIERKKIEAMKGGTVDEAPVVENPDKTDTPSILDKVKKDEGRLPGKNPLLPNGRRSEQEILASLQASLVSAAKEGRLTSPLFFWKGKKAKIKGADDKKLTLEVSSEDKKTGEELVYRTSAKWEDVKPEDMLQLYDRTPELTDTDKLAIVIYCFDSAFMDEAAQRAFQLFQLRNDWKEAIDTLIATKRKIAIPSEGFVEYEGALITPDEKENAIFYAELRAVLERFEKGVGNKDKRKREDAEKAFVELLEMGDRAVKPAVEILQGVLDKEMENAKKATGLMSNDKAKMDSLLAELDRRRAYALELIMDAEKYPYPYGPNQAEVQADVDERVAAVREIWNDPAKFTGQTNPEFDAIMEKIQAIAQRMATIDPAQDYYKQTPEETVEYISNIANEALSIRNYTGDDTKKQSLYNTNVKVMQYNEDHPTGATHADAESREQVRITNEYRIMFSRVALKINDKLFWAAHHHSRYCVEHNGGQIAHVIEGEPRGAGPGDRMRYEGYSGGGGENIHMNSGTPTALSSHNSWCHSSGHHRNILTPGWRVLGSARWQTIWTQNFGAQDEGDQNAVSKGGE
ncbi:MAG: FHA domain-containing protein [Planctomycetes bacterium]|nr:FHA domain-containing protein [Planctomycetota bacterium]